MSNVSQDVALHDVILCSIIHLKTLAQFTAASPADWKLLAFGARANSPEPAGYCGGKNGRIRESCNNYETQRISVGLRVPRDNGHAGRVPLPDMHRRTIYHPARFADVPDKRTKADTQNTH